jgi:hypothetical protein
MVTMTRKIEAALRTWIPWIIQTYQDSEELTTFVICKTIGRQLVGLQDGEQLEEINRVLDKLVEDGYLTKVENSKAQVYFWGVNFDSYIYTPTDNISVLIDSLNQTRRKTSMKSGDTYNFNGQIGQAIINSPSAVMNIEITNTDGLNDETKQLLEDLKVALAKKDQSAVKQALGYIADKGVDVVLQLALGGFFMPRQ